MATHPGMGNLSERMPYKTWVLKVSIHCEGCKKKVRKVIQSIEGVYSVDIDIKQHRVVVTGNVEGDTLVKRLLKSGKNAELWPQMAPPQEKKPRNLKKKEVQFDPEPSIPQEPKHGGSEREKPVKKVEPEHEPAKTSGGESGGAPEKGESSAAAERKSHGDGGATVVKADGGSGVAQSRDPSQNRDGGSGGAVKSNDGGAEISGSGGPVAEPKAEGKKPDMGSAVNEPPAKAPATATAEDNKGGEGGATAESTQPSQNGTNGKKKKKKGQSTTAVGEPSSFPTSASRGLHHHSSPPPGVNLDRPRHHGYEYPPHYYTPPPPVATVSYSTAYPTASHTTSYYAAPAPPSYAYAYPRPETEPPPYDFQSYPQQPLDSFEMFSDENPNGCFIM